MIQKIKYYVDDTDLEQIMNFSSEYCRSKGLTVQFEKINFTDQYDLPQLINADLNNEQLGLRIGLGLSSGLVSELKVASHAVNTLQAVDGFLPATGKLWPALLSFDVLRDLIVGKFSNLDMKDIAYVIGEGPRARLCVALALSLGYRKVVLVSDLLDQIEIDKKIVLHSFIGSEIQLLELDSLTLQTVSSSLLFIVKKIEVGSEVESDVAYFNFLKSKAVVVNFNVFPLQGAISEEAERAGFRLISGGQINAEIEFQFLSKLGLLKKEDHTGFVQQWMDFLETKSANEKEN